MLSYYIGLKKSDRSLLQSTQALNPANEEDREPFLRRMLKRHNYKIGQPIKQKGSRLTGKITKIIRDATEVTWQKNVPYFIMVAWSNGTESLCNPRQLSRKK